MRHAAIRSPLLFAEAPAARRLVLVALPAIAVLKHAAVERDPVQGAARVAPGIRAEVEHGFLAVWPHSERAHHPADPIGPTALRRQHQSRVVAPQR